MLRADCPHALIVLAYCPRWSAVDRALHDAMEDFGWHSTFVPLRRFVPDSLLRHGLPNGACLVLLTPEKNTIEEDNAKDKKNTWKIKITTALHKERGWYMRITMEDLEWCVMHDVTNVLWEFPQEEEEEEEEEEVKNHTNNDIDSKNIGIVLEIMVSGPKPILQHHLQSFSRLLKTLSVGKLSSVTRVVIKNTWINIPTLLLLFHVLIPLLPNVAHIYLGNLVGIDWCSTSLQMLFATLPTTFASLDIYGSSIGNDGVRRLAIAMQPHRLTKINLSSNDITSIGVERLGRLVLLNSTTLVELDLSGNVGIGPNGAAELAEVLPKAAALKKLDLSGCGFGDLGIKWLCAGLQKCSQLTTLSVASNGIEQSGCLEILNCLLQHCKQLEIVDLSSNDVEVEEFKEQSKILLEKVKFQVLLHRPSMAAGEKQIDKLKFSNTESGFGL